MKFHQNQTLRRFFGHFNPNVAQFWPIEHFVQVEYLGTTSYSVWMDQSDFLVKELQLFLDWSDFYTISGLGAPLVPLLLR